MKYLRFKLNILWYGIRVNFSLQKELKPRLSFFCETCPRLIVWKKFAEVFYQWYIHFYEGKFIYSYVHDAIDMFCNKCIHWDLNALVSHMKKDESLYDKLLSSLFTFRTFFGCWQNTFQIPIFNANFLLFLYILMPSSFLPENNYELWRLLQHKYRLFQKLWKDFGFHRNQCKMQINAR